MFDELFAKLSMFENLVVLLACGVVTFLVRRVVETALPHLTKPEPYPTTFARWWNKVVLYALPVVLGALLFTLFYRSSVEHTATAVLWGAELGFFCGFGFKGFSALLGQRTGVAAKADGGPPVAGDEDPKVHVEVP
jgi:hypothetical protein